MRSTISIRPAVAAERAALEALQWRASLANAGDRENLLANPDAIFIPLEQIESGLVFVAERHGELAGFSALLRRQLSEIELDGLFVEPSLWRSGIGRALVEHCSAFARAERASALHVVANPHAAEFYAACGFEPVGLCETRFGAALTMRKRL